MRFEAFSGLEGRVAVFLFDVLSDVVFMGVNLQVMGKRYDKAYVGWARGPN